MINLTFWLVLTLMACELKVIVEYPGETGVDSADDTALPEGARPP
jgi:hypothetical protein